jgi:uncharacterized protein YcbK (DUF882 family)
VHKYNSISTALNTSKRKPLVKQLLTGVVLLSLSPLSGCISSPSAPLENVANSQGAGTQEDTQLQRSDLNNAPEVDYSLKQVSGSGPLTLVPVPKKRQSSIFTAPQSNAQNQLIASNSIAAVIENNGAVTSRTPNVISPADVETTTPKQNNLSTATALAAQPQKKKRTSIFDFFSNPTPRPTAAVQKTNPTRVVAARKNTAKPNRKRKSGIFDLFSSKTKTKKTRVASLASLSRTKNNLIKQTSRVQVDCFKPALLTILQKVERRYGKRVIVTSGYRSKSANRRARGARNSAHVYCMAADIQVPGVSKWKLASYLRTLPGRGGVGTYCHTKSVHIDVGQKRDWNWRCRKRRKK